MSFFRDIKKIIMIAVAIIGVILILIFQHGLYSTPAAQNPDLKEKLAQITHQIQTDKPEVVSTNPSPLEGAILWATQPVEITFNLPLENAPEFKHKIDPKFDYKVELSDDKKTIKIIPTKQLPLGMTFTLSISGETKFDGKKTLGKDYTFHFKTIEYRGV